LKRRTLTLILVVLLVAASTTMLLSTTEARTQAIGYPGSTKIMEFMSLVYGHYVDDIEWDVLVEGALNGILNATGDPHSRYFDQQELSVFMEGLGGEYVGVGIMIVEDEMGLRILEVFADSPAERAGLEVEDVITGVDSMELEGMSLEEASSRIKGQEGTEVTLQVQRGSQQLVFTMKREIISYSTVEWRVLEGGDIGYISISSFTGGSARDVGAALSELHDAGVGQLIMDLRDNPGGSVSEAVSVADYFLPPDALVVRMLQRTSEIRLRAENPKAIDWPVLVLMNENTASAAEFLAGALKDYGVAKLVGETTFGKGTAQAIYTFSDGSGVKLTTAHFLTAAGRRVDETGLTPDHPFIEGRLYELGPYTEYLDPDSADFRPMTEGAVGLDVLALQKALTLLNYESGEHNGVFAKETRGAVETFEAQEGLPVNGAMTEGDIRRILARLDGETIGDPMLEEAIEIMQRK